MLGLMKRDFVSLVHKAHKASLGSQGKPGLNEEDQGSQAKLVSQSLPASTGFNSVETPSEGLESQSTGLNFTGTPMDEMLACDGG